MSKAEQTQSRPLSIVSSRWFPAACSVDFEWDIKHISSSGAGLVNLGSLFLTNRHLEHKNVSEIDFDKTDVC